MNLLSKISERERKFIIIGVIVVSMIVLFEGYTWYQELRRRADEFTDARLVMLDKQLMKISGKDQIEKRLTEVKQQIENREKAILQGDKPPIAAAALSRIIREAAATQGINIALERTLNPAEIHSYVAVPVEVGFTTTTEKLKEFLYRLRISSYLLNISEIKVRVTNITNPSDIFASVIVIGYIKRPAEEETIKENKEAKNVT
ncbi:MAG: hypothetical protein C4538_00200 [Nitrospiraceae bacterium]|nr:MAG: hypothetical protein C4538_00200 [Nitrospiraceae bacterium]